MSLHVISETDSSALRRFCGCFWQESLSTPGAPAYWKILRLLTCVSRAAGVTVKNPVVFKNQSIILTVFVLISQGFGCNFITYFNFLSWKIYFSLFFCFLVFYCWRQTLDWIGNVSIWTFCIFSRDFHLNLSIFRLQNAQFENQILVWLFNHFCFNFVR